MLLRAYSLLAWYMGGCKRIGMKEERAVIEASVDEVAELEQNLAYSTYDLPPEDWHEHHGAK